jgi:hypothetical protein
MVFLEPEALLNQAAVVALATPRLALLQRSEVISWVALKALVMLLATCLLGLEPAVGALASVRLARALFEVIPVFA